MKTFDRKQVKVKGSSGNNFKSGRGFSLTELKEADIPYKKAKNISLPIDKRRKTCHPDNVKVLLKYKEGLS